MKKKLLIPILLVLFTINSNAQIRVTHEIGGSIGPALINGDWGSNSTMGELFGFGGVELNFIHGMQFVRSRMSIKNNLGVTYVGLSQGKDEWTVNNPIGDDPLAGDKMKAMSGSSLIVSLGSQMEYNFMDFGIYYPRNSWTPYVGLGFNVLYYMPTVETSYGDGDITNPANIHPVYLAEDGSINGITNQSGVNFSLKGAVGAKFKVSRFMSVYGELVVQRTFSDNIDGLAPTASQNVDYINGFNLGIRYSLY